MATLQMISWKQIIYYCRYIPRMVHLSLMLILICFGAIGHGFNDAAAKKVIEDSPLELHNEVIWQPKQSWTPIVSYYTWNPIPRSQIHAYSRKLLAFNKYSVSPPTLSKGLPMLVSLPTTSPPQSPTSTKEGTNPTLRVYPPLPSHAPYYGNSYVAPSYDRLRSPPQTIPIIAYAPDQSPKQAKVPSLQLLDHGYSKSLIVISPAHMSTSSAELSLMPLPVPLPNPECGNVCMVPYTKTPLGSPCGCVIPLKVELELDVALYVLFPQISVLSGEIAEGTLLSQKQVRIVGAKLDKRDQAKSIVTIDLLPLGKQFDNISVLLIFQRFWKHDISLNTTLFGNYTVRFVHYPGLPLSPSQSGRGGLGEQPFALNVKRKRRSETNKATIALIALSSVIAVAILLMALWFMILKFGNCIKQPPIRAPTNTPAVAKNTDYVLSSETASSTTLSFVFSVGPHTGSAKSFTLAELERATEKFKPQNMVGEGGSSRVYRGVLDDGIEVAVKVLTRDDQQGRKRFISEVEMLSRLHHRNLVKLLGICTEDHSRCLVYELVINGSVESHLHGVDKERSPLDWDARMRIALGAARGLAYIHEDSNPGVVHRDFKAANILLEDDFTPKISDFELAKDVSDEPSSHISTRVMGTFGYVAPEYVMTGHLLVKSDVYSYGVVLLELLTGRKPVDMSQPPGEENLVTWARPLLANKEGLETLVDPTLRDGFPWESMARVAAVASMCVQPEVSYRPFMGEVVQALKLVCNDSDGSNGITSIGESPSRENSTPVYVHESVSRVIHVDYESNPMYASDSPKDRPHSASAVLSSPRRFLRQFSCSFRRHSTSGSSSYKVKGSDRGSMSERTLRRPFGTGFGQDIYGLWS